MKVKAFFSSSLDSLLLRSPATQIVCEYFSTFEDFVKYLRRGRAVASASRPKQEQQI